MNLHDDHRSSRIRTGCPMLLVLLFVFVARDVAARPNFPPLSGRVVDEAGILSPSARAGLTEMLARHERATGEQVVVVTLKSLQGYSIEDFGYQLGRQWGIGQQGKNTGAILIVAPNERKVRIEVGYGLEGQLTDAASRIIIEREILPSFRNGDFNAGVVAGTASIVTLLSGEARADNGVEAQSQSFEDSPWSILLLVTIAVAIMLLKARLSQRPLGPVYGARGRSFGLPPPIDFRTRGGGSFGGGGFSGGGGSFGGGGASGSW